MCVCVRERERVDVNCLKLRIYQWFLTMFYNLCLYLQVDMTKPELRNGIKMDQEDERQETEEMLSNGRTLTKSHESEDETEDKNQGLPIDRGWAWVVLGGTFELNCTPGKYCVVLIVIVA